MCILSLKRPKSGRLNGTPQKCSNSRSSQPSMLGGKSRIFIVYLLGCENKKLTILFSQRLYLRPPSVGLSPVMWQLMIYHTSLGLVHHQHPVTSKMVPASFITVQREITLIGIFIKAAHMLTVAQKRIIP